jgi:hypothetical protein
MIDPGKIQLTYLPKRPFRWERWYGTEGKMWQASCQFDVKVEIDPSVSEIDAANIEYRQFIRGGVWIRRGNQEWTADNNPNGNGYFPIPPYAGQNKVSGIPMKAVPGTGLSFSWKEDGQIESGGTERFGYRETANVETANEIDKWSNPTQLSGRSYRLRDTPSISGRWGSGDSVSVWIELWFRGFVVEVNRDDPANNSVPVRLLKQKEWSYFWQDQKLSLWSDATSIAA